MENLFVSGPGPAKPVPVLVRKTLFTVVFTLFLIIFYAIVRGVALQWFPGLLEIPVEITPDYFLAQTALFAGIVLLSFWGASSVTYSRAGEREGFVPETPLQRRRSVLREEDGDR